MLDRGNFLCHSLEAVWTDKILIDFTVKIDDETFECHRLVLTMFSDFFAALFRSGMKEVHENSITLHDISPETFQLILEAVYTDANPLTSDNVIDVWRASHQLQIPTLLHMCEDFASTNITGEKWESMYSIAKCFQAENVLAHFQQFTLENFNEVCISSTFLQLPFEELRDLVKSQDLVVSSEDLVMESVIRWVTYDPNVKNERNDDTEESHEDTSTIEISDKHLIKVGLRRDYLNKLFKKIRTCLVSRSLLTRVRNMELLADNREITDIIDYALSYNAKNFRHCQCPSPALPRSCSGYILAGVYAKFNGCIKVISANTEKSFHICDCDYLVENIQFVTFDGKLYATGRENNDEPCRMYVYCFNTWRIVKNMPGNNILLLSHGNFIYILNKEDRTIYSMKPKMKRKYLTILTEFPEYIFLRHAMFLQNVLLLFGNDQTGNNKTVIYKMEISYKVWIRLTNLDGPAKQLISFKNDKHDYILQTNGSLRLVLYSSDTGNVKFKFLAKLWNFEKRLYGGLTFQSKLIIFGNKPDTDPPEEKKSNKVDHHFKCISYLGTDDKNASNFVPFRLQDFFFRKKVA